MYKHQQIFNTLREKIFSGELKNLERLQTEKELCKLYSVSRITIRQAIKELERQHLVKRIAGNGTFVSYSLENDCTPFHLLVPTLHNNYYSKMGNEFAKFFRNKKSIASILCTNYDPQYTNKLLQFIEKTGTKGVAIIASGNYNSASALIQSIKKLSIPVIIGSKELPHFKNTQIITDEAKGVSDVVHYLYSKGHRRIAYGGNKEGFYSAVIRYQAFHRTCSELGLNIEHCPCIEKTDVLAMRKLKTLFSDDNAPTAIITASEVIALDIYELLSIINLKIPDDIAVIALEGGTLAPSFETPLTTLEFPGKELGERLATTLWEQAIGEKEKKRTVIKIPPKLIIRSSCGANKDYLRHDYLRNLIQ